MMISARNQLDVVVEEIRRGAVNALVVLKTSGGTRMFASITLESADALNLRIGAKVVAFFKASHVLVATGWAMTISARNKLEGKIESITPGTINCDLRIRLQNSDMVTAVITNEAAADLNLKPNDPVLAVIKATDVMIAC